PNEKEQSGRPGRPDCSFSLGETSQGVVGLDGLLLLLGGRVPRVTLTVMLWLLRTRLRVTVSPGLWVSKRLVSGWVSSMGVLSTDVITSPAWMPAPSAGLPCPTCKTNS